MLDLDVFSVFTILHNGSIFSADKCITVTILPQISRTGILQYFYAAGYGSKLQFALLAVLLVIDRNDLLQFNSAADNTPLKWPHYHKVCPNYCN